MKKPVTKSGDGQFAKGDILTHADMNSLYGELMAVAGETFDPNKPDQVKQGIEKMIEQKINQNKVSRAKAFYMAFA